MTMLFTNLLGVRRPGAALLSINRDRGQSGARPPHSKEAPHFTDMRILLLILLLATLALPIPVAFSQTSAIDGFTADRVAAERRWEEQFRAVPTSQSAREHLRRLTREPHVAGTKEDYATAVYVRDQLRSYGLSADLKEYDVWLNYPRTPSVLELITTARQPLDTREAVVSSDPTSSNP